MFDLIGDVTKESTVKALVFHILSREYPLKIIELSNHIRKRYGKSVTFQAVRKSLLEMESQGILLRNDKEFEINKEWALKGKQQMDTLYEALHSTENKPSSSIQEEVSTFTFDSINAMMLFWESIVDKWFAAFNKGDPNINCFQGQHGWEGVMHAAREQKLMSQLQDKGIKSYALSSGTTALDRHIWKFYKSIGLEVGIYASNSPIDKLSYVGTYGEIIIQTTYPKEIAKALDEFFEKNTTMEQVNLTELFNITNTKCNIKLTIIKNLAMAEQINKSIIEKII